MGVTFAGERPARHLALQFLALSVREPSAVREWRGPVALPLRATFAERTRIGADPRLPLTQRRTDEREILCLGTILDPHSAQDDGPGIIGRLLELDSFGELELALGGLAGRWLLFVRLGNEQRIYPDAAGLRSCFYASSAGGWVAASQPQLIAAELEIAPRCDPRQGLKSSAWADTYPIASTPFPGIHQLPPNHYLDARSARAHRFWPTSPVPTLSTPEAARGVAQLLRGSVSALARRGRSLSLPLTGGYDSRTLLAAAWEHRHELDCFTVIDAATPAHDIVLPLRLARAFGLKHRFIWAGRGSRRMIQGAVLNTGGVWRDPNEERVPAFGELGDTVCLLGNVSEIIRAGFFEYGDYPEQVTPEGMAALTGWEANPEAIAACREWLSNAPQSEGLQVLDLFYWEARVGGWAALDCLATDGFVEVVSPYNCRELLRFGLGVSPAARRVVLGRPDLSCALHRGIVDALAPEMLAFPFNDNWLGRVVPTVRAALPAPMKGMLKRLRTKVRQLAG